jgi:hypothetical protein
MLQLVKTKRQANFKGFKRFGAFKGLVEQKNVVFNSFVCKLGPIYTQTRQIIAVWPDCGHGHTYLYTDGRFAANLKLYLKR